MSDRPTAVNGKRNQAWGTTNACPQCGECLCFGCHPDGPCVDEHVRLAPESTDESSRGPWTFQPEGRIGVAGMQLRSR